MDIPYHALPLDADRSGSDEPPRRIGSKVVSSSSRSRSGSDLKPRRIGSKVDTSSSRSIGLRSLQGSLSGHKIPNFEPADALPCMVTVMEKLAEMKTTRPDMFTFRPCDDEEEEDLFLEIDLAFFAATLLSEVSGATNWDKMKRILRLLSNKKSLIESIQAVESFLMRLHNCNSDMAGLLHSERLAYFRCAAASAWKTDAGGSFNSVTLKLCQMVWFVNFVYHTPECVQKSIHYPPKPIYRDVVWMRLDEEMRTDLRPVYGDELPSEDATQPLHPQWFAHDIPFLDTPFYAAIVSGLAEAQDDNPEVWGLRMSFCRTFVSEILGVLRSQLELVKSIEVRLLGLAMALLTTTMTQVAQREESAWNSTAIFANLSASFNQ